MAYQTIDDLIFNQAARAGLEGATISEIAAAIGRSTTCVRKHVTPPWGNGQTVLFEGRVRTYRRHAELLKQQAAEQQKV